MTEPQRFFFVHLQKTAGTTLFQRMKRHFGEAAVYPGPGDGRPPDAVLVVEHLQERFEARKDVIRVVTGHFPLCTAEVLGVPFITLTVLRDPVERTLSYLRHHRKKTPGAADAPMEAIYDDPLRFHGLIHNHMVKMLSLTPEEMIAGSMTRVIFDRARLERAKDNLAAIDLFGLQDRFEQFCEELTARYGWNLGSPAHTNRTEPAEVSTDLIARIIDDNAHDIELFEFARTLHERRAAPGRSA